MGRSVNGYRILGIRRLCVSFEIQDWPVFKQTWGRISWEKLRTDEWLVVLYFTKYKNHAGSQGHSFCRNMLPIVKYTCKVKVFFPLCIYFFHNTNLPLSIWENKSAQTHTFKCGFHKTCSSVPPHDVVECDYAKLFCSARSPTNNIFHSMKS